MLDSPVMALHLNIYPIIIIFVSPLLESADVLKAVFEI